ncbi:hypothetical protein ACJX0J_036964, partial [Zea mays]
MFVSPYDLEAQAFQRTIEFEEELAEEFSGGTTNARNKETTSDDEDEGGGHNKIVSDIRKKYEKKLAAPNDEFNLHGIISSCCEPYMIVYIELEEKALVDQLEKLVQVLGAATMVSQTGKHPGQLKGQKDWREKRDEFKKK